ncbi:SDR family oxidoreductase [Aquimarina celericrescens]|uniref:SDR family oxidoreductase n=1 Tax=Aquimarina celericrescens TaxID=1964542 RepID=A0ABW5B1R5_9FLAO|nr:SDR family oxidoreductase [Aquimarina celericrescens]
MNYTPSLFSIDKKIIVITGATGVLGMALSRYLASQDSQMIIMGRNPEKTNNLAKDIIKSGGKAEALLIDVTCEETLENAATSLKEKFGKIDVLINMAGGNMEGAVIQPDQNFVDFDTNALRDVLDLNYFGTVLSIKKMLPLLLESNEASIINISSMAATRPMTRVMGYASAKAAVENITKWLAVEFSHKYEQKIRVNAIAPGFFLTEQNRTLLLDSKNNLTDRGAKIIENTPMGRFGHPDELFGAVQWLSSEASKFVTGTVVAVDGGFDSYAGV